MSAGSGLPATASLAGSVTGLRGLSVSVNLSAKQFAQPDLSERVGRVLHATGLVGHHLQLEITESAVMEHAGAATAVLAQLRALDVQLAVDDFGTSYSSLSYLKRFPLDTLKIDQAFVRGLGKDPDDTAIVQAIVSLAHTLGLQVTAEGVETTRQVRRLQALGCRMPGFLLYQAHGPRGGLGAVATGAADVPAPAGTLWAGPGPEHGRVAQAANGTGQATRPADGAAAVGTGGVGRSAPPSRTAFPGGVRGARRLA